MRTREEVGAAGLAEQCANVLVLERAPVDDPGIVALGATQHDDTLRRAHEHA
jgi:hypothetical protein